MGTLVYRIYQICIAVPVLLVLTLLTALVTTGGSFIGSASFWGYHPGKIWSRLICYILFLPIRVNENPHIRKKTSYIFVANHQGAFDIFLIYGFLGRNFKWMMKKSLRSIPFVGKACQSAGHVFVDKSGPKKVQETIDHARHTLRDGMSLVVFPEGRRTPTGHMGNFKKGAFQLADELRLPVVPLSIEGSFEVLPRSGGFIKRHRMTLTMHDPILPQGEGPDNIRETMESAFQAIQHALPEKYKALKPEKPEPTR